MTERERMPKHRIMLEPIQKFGVPPGLLFVIMPGILALLYNAVPDPATRATIVDLELLSGTALGVTIFVETFLKGKIRHVRPE